MSVAFVYERLEFCVICLTSFNINLCHWVLHCFWDKTLYNFMYLKLLASDTVFKLFSLGILLIQICCT